MHFKGPDEAGDHGRKGRSHRAWCTIQRVLDFYCKADSNFEKVWDQRLKTKNFETHKCNVSMLVLCAHLLCQQLTLIAHMPCSKLFSEHFAFIHSIISQLCLGCLLLQAKYHCRCGVYNSEHSKISLLVEFRIQCGRKTTDKNK